MMSTTRSRTSARWLLMLTLLVWPVLGLHAKANDHPDKTLPPVPEVFTKVAPESVEELKSIQEHVKAVVDKVTPAVVGVRIGAGQGSGVIVSEDGYVLTAAHVSGPAGRPVTIILPDGRKVKGETLGANRRVDASLIKITTKGKWPHVEMGDSTKLEKGTWCVAIGHPKGYIPGRTPVVRLGRVLDSLKALIRTDCTLVGGDSGGPLFDMEGKVIGIHSRIGPSIIYNIHVPISQYHDDWEMLVKGEVFPGADRPWLGVQGDPEADECRIFKVHPGSPADKAGLKEDDVIIRFAGQKIDVFSDLVNEVSRQRPNARVEVVVLRNGETVTLKLTIGRQSD